MAKRPETFPRRLRAHAAREPDALWRTVEESGFLSVEPCFGPPHRSWAIGCWCDPTLEFLPDGSAYWQHHVLH